MKRLSRKAIAVICSVAMILPMAACNTTDPTSGHSRRSNGDSEKPRWTEGTEPTTTVDPVDPTSPSDPTDPTTPPGQGNYIPTSDTLIYPDHVATVDEIHPYHAPGNVTGKAAVSQLSEVEMDIIHHQITCYADVEILFDDPSKYGFDITDITWGDIGSIDDYDDEKEFYQEQLDKLFEIDYESLTDDDKLCYDKIVYDCEEYVYMYSYTAFEYYTMTFNYLVGPQSEILFIMEVYSFDTVKDAENYIALIKDIDRYFDQLCEYEETRASLGFASSDTSYEEAAKSFDNLVKQKDDCFLYGSFEERLDNIKNLSDSDRTRLISEHEKAMKEVVFPEFQECADRMRALKGSGGVDAGLCEYRGGDAYYAMLTRRQTNSGATVAESIEILDKTIADIYNEFSDITSSGFDWYNEYADHKYTKGDINDNLDFLYGEIKRDFPSIPAHSYFMLDVPEVFQDNFSPAAYLGYHLDNYDSNMLIVNNASVDDDFGITVAHEAYPGHMFQSIYTRDHTSHPYMFLSESTGYLEGWATYTENYSMKYFSDSDNVTDGMKVIKDESLMSLLLGTRVDYGIHVENWSLSDCVDYFNSFGFGVSEKSFSKYYTLLVTDPCYYAKYGMGYLWTQKTMDDMHQKHPNATDLEIHTAYLNSLTGTFEQINAYMDKKLV